MHINPLDLSGASLSLLSTYYFIRAKISAWFFSIIAVIVGIILYYQKGIYADMWLHTGYLLASAYGLWYWGFRGMEKKEREITTITWQHGALLALFTLTSIISIHYFLIHYTHSQVPYMDAATTSLSLTAQWLTCRKILQNWLVWFAADVIYAALYFYKGIPMHALVHSGYLALAVIGYYNWRRKLIPSSSSIKIQIGTKCNHGNDTNNFC